MSAEEAAVAEVVKVAGGIIEVRRRVRKPRTQVNARLPVDLARRLRVYAVEHDLLVMDIVEAGVRAVLNGRRAA